MELRVKRDAINIAMGQRLGEVWNLYNDVQDTNILIQNLEKFETDNEELAHKLSAIIKSGGDYSEILWILERGNKTDLL